MIGELALGRAVRLPFSPTPTGISTKGYSGVVEICLNYQFEFRECGSLNRSPFAEISMAGIAGHDGLFRSARNRSVMAAAFMAPKRYREIHDPPPEASFSATYLIGILLCGECFQ